MRIRLAIVAAATLALAGCGSSGGGTRAASGAPSTPTASTPIPSATPTPAGPAPGACANGYFPVVTGATWTYRSHVAQTTAVVRQTVATMTGSGFTTVSSSPQGSERDVWTCGAGGLADVQQHVSGTSSTISFGGQTFQTGVQNFHHYRSRGVTVPPGLDVGSSWTQVVRSSSRFELAGASYPETQIVTTVSRVIGRGSVTTPAGSFDGLKVRTTATTRKAIPALGQHLTSVVHGTMWVVRDVGIVEATTTNSSGFVTTRTLLSYRIPGAS